MRLNAAQDSNEGLLGTYLVVDLVCPLIGMNVPCRTGDMSAMLIWEMLFDSIPCMRVTSCTVLSKKVTVWERSLASEPYHSG